MLSPRAARDRNNVIQYLRPRREQDHRGKGLCGVLTASNPSDLGHAERLMYGRTHLAFRFLTAVDVEGFSRRPTAEQAKIQDDLEFAISTAASRADLDRRRWYRQPRGDGELAVLPQGVNGLSLVADYPRSLAVVLGEINRSANPGSRLRIRVAIHHGAVFPGGPFGPVGAAPILESQAPGGRRVIGWLVSETGTPRLGGARAVPAQTKARGAPVVAARTRAPV